MRDWRPRLRAASLALSLLLLDFGQGAHPAGAHGLHDPPGAHAVREPARVPVARPAGQFPPSALHSLYVLMQGVPGSGQPGIVRIDPPSFAPVIITEGQLLTSPVDIAVDPNGNILVLNVASCSGVISVQCNGITGVIRVDPSTGVQTPLTSGPSYFATPVALAVAPNGTIYVVDSNCCQVFQFPDGYLTGGVIAIDPNTGAQWVVSNPNSSGEYLVAPWGIAVDPNGNPVVVQEGQFLLSHTRVIKIDPASGAQTSVVSGGSLDDPVAIAINDANWYFVADRQCCSDGALIYVNPANASETVVSTGGQFQLPADVALPPGNVISPAYLLDSNCCAGYRGGIFAIDFNTGAQQLVAQNLAGGRLEAIAVVPTPTGNPPVAAPGRLPTSGPTAPRASASSLTPTPGATRTAAGVAGAPAAGTLAPNVPAPTQITPTPLTRAPIVAPAASAAPAPAAPRPLTLSEAIAQVNHHFGKTGRTGTPAATAAGAIATVRGLVRGSAQVSSGMTWTLEARVPPHVDPGTVPFAVVSTTSGLQGFPCNPVPAKPRKVTCTGTTASQALQHSLLAVVFRPHAVSIGTVLGPGPSSTPTSTPTPVAVVPPLVRAPLVLPPPPPPLPPPLLPAAPPRPVAPAGPPPPPAPAGVPVVPEADPAWLLVAGLGALTVWGLRRRC